MLRPHRSADSDHRSANWRHSDLGAQSGRENQPACVCMFVCPCQSVCLSACISQKPHVRTSRNLLFMLTVVVARSFSDNNAMRYVVPVLWMSSRLPIIDQAKATPVGRILKVTHQGQNRGRSLMPTIALFCCLSSMRATRGHGRMYMYIRMYSPHICHG